MKPTGRLGIRTDAQRFAPLFESMQELMRWAESQMAVEGSRPLELVLRRHLSIVLGQ
jgi:hypothetical protein